MFNFLEPLKYQSGKFLFLFKAFLNLFIVGKFLTSKFNSFHARRVEGKKEAFVFDNLKRGIE